MKYGELALLYFPHLKQQSATISLRRWINTNVELKRRLISAGWQDYQKYLTPRQVEVFYAVLGKPVIKENL